jgi:putative DNA primase/helicase
MTAREVAGLVRGRPAGKGKWQAKCPAHQDRNPSLSIREGRDGYVLLKCHAGCDLKDILEKLRLTVADISGGADHAPRHGKSTMQIDKTYPYTDAAGKLLYEVVRLLPKGFRQRRPDGTWNLNGVERVLFHLPEVLAADVVLIAEGEKDVLNLEEAVKYFAAQDGRRYAATTNPGGAGKWLHKYSQSLQGKSAAYVFEDNDDPGRKHAENICASIRTRVREVRLVDLPDLPDKGDVSDWLRDHTVQELWQLMQSAPPVPAGNSAPDPSAATVEYSEDALALKFTAEHGDRLRYTAEWNRWSKWNGRVWTRDTTCHVFDHARAICRAESTRARCDSPPAAARKISSAATVAAVERLARSDRHHAATVEQWDRDLWLLNTPGGVVDLRTGTLRSAQREDYMTKITAVGPGARCPLWLRFLDRITSGNREMQAFMQRMCGYALTGVTREHAFFFLYGTGGNGKGTFINTLAELMGAYAKTAPIEILLDSKNERHPTELAGLQGARLVTAVETEDGRRWSESRVKMLTGGDPVPARYMHQDFFEYTPQFKLIISGNHKPGLRTVDEAMRRRINLLPFTVTIPDSERDDDLREKLRGEWPGILQWAIEGCLAWQRDGLSAPQAVRDATADYLATEDAMARWREERCEESASSWESTAALFKDWREWTVANNEFTGSQKRFSQYLVDRGFVKDRTRTTRGFRGIALRAGAVTHVTDHLFTDVTRAHTRIRTEPDDVSHVSPEQDPDEDEDDKRDNFYKQEF